MDHVDERCFKLWLFSDEAAAAAAAAAAAGGAGEAEQGRQCGSAEASQLCVGDVRRQGGGGECRGSEPFVHPHGEQGSVHDQPLQGKETV